MKIKCVVCVSFVSEKRDLENYSEVNFYDLVQYTESNLIQRSILYDRNSEKPFPEEMQFWIDYSRDNAQELLDLLVLKLQLVYKSKKIKEIQEELPPF